MARFRDSNGGASSSEQAKPNPIGFPKPDEVQLVQTKHGSMVHVYNPSTKTILCNSGKNAGRSKANGTQTKGKNELHKSDATQVSCYRCAKLLSINNGSV